MFSAVQQRTYPRYAKLTLQHEKFKSYLNDRHCCFFSIVNLQPRGWRWETRGPQCSLRLLLELCRSKVYQMIQSYGPLLRQTSITPQCCIERKLIKFIVSNILYCKFYFLICLLQSIFYPCRIQDILIASLLLADKEELNLCYSYLTLLNVFSF